MRATVGPLPSAVYWRRRAVVLGAVLLGIIVLFVSCSGGGDDKDKNRGTGSPASQLPTPAPASTTPSSPDPSFLDGVPGGNGPSLPALGDLETTNPGGDGGDDGDSGTNGAGGQPPANQSGQNQSGQNQSGQNTNVTAPTDGSCGDNEIALAAGLPAATVKRGVPVQMTVTIKNIGTRTCNRDVGAGPQELYLDSGANKFWSSDTCSTDRSADVKQFAPGQQRTFKTTWNGRQSSACVSNAPSGPNPPAGQYDLRARLGTLYSNPVTLTINS
jgi:hypothetical protein